MPAFAAAARFNQSPLKKALSPSITPSVDLPLTFFDAQGDLHLVLRREILEVEGLARSDPDARKLSAHFRLVCFRRRKLQREVEVFEEVRLHELHADVRKLDGRR